MRLLVLLGVLCACEDTTTSPATDSVASETDASTPADADTDTDTDTDLTTPTPPITTPVDDSPQQECVDIINAYRATEGLPPLGRWAKAETCVDGEAEADSISGIPHSAFPSCGESAQNECPGWGGTYSDILDGCLAMMWAEGPGEPFSEHGHYINMSSLSYTEVACGFFTTKSGSVWAVQDFR